MPPDAAPDHTEVGSSVLLLLLQEWHDLHFSQLGAGPKLLNCIESNACIHFCTEMICQKPCPSLLHPSTVH